MQKLHCKLKKSSNFQKIKNLQNQLKCLVEGNKRKSKVLIGKYYLINEIDEAVDELLINTEGAIKQ